VFDFVRNEPRFQVVYRELGIRPPAIAAPAAAGN